MFLLFCIQVNGPRKNYIFVNKIPMTLLSDIRFSKVNLIRILIMVKTSSLYFVGHVAVRSIQHEARYCDGWQREEWKARAGDIFPIIVILLKIIHKYKYVVH